MKALILAAGLGSRLAPITDTCPKSLVPINGKPILIKQIENLYENKIKDITIIAGYKAEILVERIKENFPQVQIIVSSNYATTNNMYSAYLGRVAVCGHDFLMMNADVFFDASVIRALISCKATNAIVTDIGNYLEESMKVIVQNERLISISKRIKQEDALGSSIDIYKFSKEAGKSFFLKCAEYIEKKNEVALWSEVALNDILKEHKFKACPLDGRWFEIDNHNDLYAAEKLFYDEK